uniref:Nephronophthisis 4 n=1 Tax=Mastacembelus armatus TaxID=205130 RepID=A0A7N8XZ77_9TELE
NWILVVLIPAGKYVLYFHTSLQFPTTVLVLELVSLSPRPDGSQQALGQGFTVLDLFTSRPEVQAAEGDRRLSLHHGSPRGLVHPLVKDTADCKGLFTIDGTHLECVLKNHPALVSMMHPLPENVLVSGDENIPGLTASPTGDVLLRPQLLKMFPFTLNRLTVTLQPSLERFESQLLQLISADCHNTQPGPEGTLRAVVIQERRLHVGVHNGWCFLEKPQVVVLEPLAPGTKGTADSTSKESTLIKDSSATSSPSEVLCLRSSLELKLANHHGLAIVFQLEYVFSAPIGPETMLSATSTSRAAFLQCLRWGIWCPFQDPSDWKGGEIQLVLHGGAKPNPYGVMVYSTEMSANTQSPMPLSAPGTTQVTQQHRGMSLSLEQNVKNCRKTTCSVSSRSSLAHLYSAGFPNIVDCSGQFAEVLDTTEPVPFDPQREETDVLQGNLMVFQFLAFTRIAAAGVGPDWPDNIYFTFQFYRFPPVTSQQLKLLSSDKVQHKTSDLLPCILATVNKDGTVNSGSPGLQVQFRVDDSFLKPGEKHWFLRYLALHTMHIDIWDSDSLLLIGSTAIELKYLLRHGKSAVQALHEVEVLTTDYVGDETLLTSADLGRHAASSPMTVHTIVRGRLHIRTGNVGKTRAADVMPSLSHIITPREVTSGFRGGSLSSRNILQLNGECFNPLNPVFDRNKDAQLAQEPLQIKPTEERIKAEGIANMLSQVITTQHLLYASLGSAEYMEFVLKNPFNVPQTVTIHSDDPELSVITNTEEWRYFKALTKTPTPLEENMFHLEKDAPGPRVYLRPKESVHIPLKYQGFLCDRTMAPQSPSWLSVINQGHSVLLIPLTFFPQVTFKAEDGKPMAICQVSVELTPHVIDQTFRLYHPQLCFLKKAIRLPPWHDPTGSKVGDPNAATQISVRCSDPNIICQTRTLVPGEPQDVYLKVPGSPSPHMKMFFVMVYTDKWMAAPSQIWQIYVHFLERVDVSCVTGQRSCQSLVLRGKQAVRKVKCFSSHPQETEMDPEGVFVLPPAAVQELQLKVQPWRAGSRFLYVNAVDVEHRRLANAWLLCLNIQQPVLSKAFEVCVPVGGGRGSSRKITYTNPYTSSRIFLLRSDHPDLLQFKEDKFQIGGGESYTIGLRFAPTQSPGSAEILVYVNNQEERTEETFCVRVKYS